MNNEVNDAGSDPRPEVYTRQSSGLARVASSADRRMLSDSGEGSGNGMMDMAVPRFGWFGGAEQPRCVGLYTQI